MKKITPAQQKEFRIELQKIAESSIPEEEKNQKIIKLRESFTTPEDNQPSNSKIEKYKNIPFQPKLRQLELPRMFPNIANRDISPLSNWIAKSAIFAPRKPGKKQDTGNEWLTLYSPKGTNILYNGPMLDMNDHTLYLNLIKLASGRGAEEQIYINRAELLKACGYKTLGKWAYDWLAKAFDRLQQANIKIELDNYAEPNKSDKKAIVAVSLISGYAQEEDGDYFFTMPPSALALFANQLYGYNNLHQRRELMNGRRVDLAAWLQSYICSDDKGEHRPLKVQTIMDYSASICRVNDFIARLKLALDNCKTAGIISTWELFYNDYKEPMIKWSR